MKLHTFYYYPSLPLPAKLAGIYTNTASYNMDNSLQNIIYPCTLLYTGDTYHNKDDTILFYMLYIP